MFWWLELVVKSVVRYWDLATFCLSFRRAEKTKSIYALVQSEVPYSQSIYALVKSEIPYSQSIYALVKSEVPYSHFPSYTVLVT